MHAGRETVGEALVSPPSLGLTTLSNQTLRLLLPLSGGEGTLSSHCEEKRHGKSCGSSQAAHLQVWGVPKAICLQCSDPLVESCDGYTTFRAMHHLEGCTVCVMQTQTVSRVPVLTQLLTSGRLERSTPPQSGQLACQSVKSEC